MTTNNVTGAGKTPKGYTAIKLFDEKTKGAKVYYVPVGKKVSFGGKTYDPSKTNNNELVIKGKAGEKNFDMIGIALEHLDVDKNGRIDGKDESWDIGEGINKDKRLPKGVAVPLAGPDAYLAGVDDKGNAYVNYTKNGSLYSESVFSISIND